MQLLESLCNKIGNLFQSLLHGMGVILQSIRVHVDNFVHFDFAGPVQNWEAIPQS